MNAVTALLWERWRRTRWAVIATFLAPLAGWIVGAAGYVTVGGLVALSFWVLGTLLLAGVLLFGQGEMQDLNLGFPKRLFRLPVRTVSLIAIYMGCGVTAMALPFLTIFGYAKVFNISFENGWTIFLIIETGFIWLQTLAWLKGARAVFFFLIPSLTGVFMLLYLAARHLLTLDVHIVCPAIILLCCGISFWNVSADRRGAWISGWQWVDSLLSLFRRKRTKDFASVLHAQTWFETRQAGYLFPVAALGFVGPVIGWKIATIILFHEFPPPALVSYKSILGILMTTLIAAWLGGALSYAVYHRDRTSGASSFWLRRPIPTKMLAFGRLKAMARSLASTLGILTVITLALLLWDWAVGAQTGMAGFIPKSLTGSSSLEVGLLAVLALFGFAVVCWVLLELPREVFLVIIGLELTYAAVLVYFGGNFVRTYKFWTSGFVRWIGCIVAAGLIMVTLRLSYMASRRKFIGTNTLLCMACAYPAAVVSLCAFLVWIGVINGWPGPMEGIYIFGAASVPFIPLAAAPLTIAKLRHR
jgi:hypothetical protein